MVVTVTLNPAIDVTAETGVLTPGRTNRLSRSVVNAGGKGVNAARMAKTLGSDVLAVGLAGGAAGEWFLSLLKREGLPHRFLRTEGELRVNMKLIDASGLMTELNGPGSAVDGDTYRAVDALLAELCAPGTVFVLSGSLPPGTKPGWYGETIRMLRGRGGRSVLDASGEALRLGVLAQPDVVKPNADEISQFDRSAYGGFLANSLGAGGARFSEGGREWFIPALKINAVSPAGAGDCMTGALAHALDRGLPPEEASLLACAAASAAVMTPGTGCPSARLTEDCRKGLTAERL